MQKFLVFNSAIHVTCSILTDQGLKQFTHCTKRSFSDSLYSEGAEVMIFIDDAENYSSNRRNGTKMAISQ